MRFGAEYFGDLANFLAQPLDAVIVCSENARHREHVIAAARAGKHILCEKPIATEVRDAEEMIRVCREEGVLFQIAFPVRYSAAIRKAREYARSGKLGNILAISSTNRGKRPGGWFEDPDLAGGGAATDHIVHLMDVFRWMLGDEVKRVYAELSKENDDSQVETHGLVLLEMHSGTIISIDPSWSYPSAFPTWGDLTMEIVGEKGTLSLDLYKQSSRWYAEDSDKTALLPWMDDLDEGLIADFVESVKEGRSPSITGEDGLRTLSVVKASYKSMETGKFIDLAEIIDS